MLSYQHGFHAGNRADVLKHAVLDAILRSAVRDRDSLLYVETHAGRGRYNLEGDQAKKTGEARTGVRQLLAGDAPRPLAPWLDMVRSSGIKAYPGSPMLAARHLRANDRMVLFERHPGEHEALAANFRDEPRVQTRAADGYAGALKLAPRSGERLLAFVDPSYETMKDMEDLADWAPRALRRWPDALIVLWLPLFADEREGDFGAYLAGLSDGVIVGARWPVDPQMETALSGSAVVAYHVPKAAGELATQIAASLQSWWSRRHPPA